MKTYTIDPLGKQRPLMLVRGTRLPEVFPDWIAEHMAHNLDANSRGLFVGINNIGSFSSMTGDTRVSKMGSGDDATALIVLPESDGSTGADWEDKNGQQCELRCNKRLKLEQYDSGTDLCYTGPYKDLRNFVRNVVPYTGQPLLAESCRQWYSYTTSNGVELTFRGCIQTQESPDSPYSATALSIDKIEFGSTLGIAEDLQITLDCDKAVFLGLSSIIQREKPYNLDPGIGWLQIVATDEFKSYLTRFNESDGDADALILHNTNYDGFTYNIALTGIFTDPNDFRLPGNRASCRIKIKEGSELCNSTIGNPAGYAWEYFGRDMSFSLYGDEYQDVSPDLNGDTVTINESYSRDKVMVIRLSNVQSNEELHIDFSGTLVVKENSPIYFMTMNARKVGQYALSSTNNVISIPEGNDMFAFFRYHNDGSSGTMTVSRVKDYTSLKEKISSDIKSSFSLIKDSINGVADNCEIITITGDRQELVCSRIDDSGSSTTLIHRVYLLPAELDIGGITIDYSGYMFELNTMDDGKYDTSVSRVGDLTVNMKMEGLQFKKSDVYDSYFIVTSGSSNFTVSPLTKEEVQQKQELINKAREPHASADELLTDVLLANNKDYVTAAFTNKVEGYTLTNAGDYTFVKGSDVADMTVVGLVMFEVVTLNNGQYTHSLLQEMVGNKTVSKIIKSVSQIPTDEWWLFIGNNNADSACSLIQAT